MRPNCFAAFNSWKTSKNRVFLPFLASTSLWPERLPRGPADNAQRLVSTATQLIRGTPGIPCDRSLVLRGEAAGRAEPPVLRSPPGPRGCPAPRAPRPRFPSHGCEAGGTQALPAIVRTESSRGIPKPHRRPHATLRGDGSRTPKLTEAPQSGCQTPRRGRPALPLPPFSWGPSSGSRRLGHTRPAGAATDHRASPWWHVQMAKK